MSADDARKLFVGGLGDAVGDVELRTFFEAADLAVEHVALPRDRETGRPRGFGFVTLTSEAEVPLAISRLNGRTILGRSLSVRAFSQEAPKRGAERAARPPDTALFVGKLPYDASDAEITALFEGAGAGPVLRVTLPIGPDGRPRGFGFVTVGSEDAQNIAIEKLDGALVRGRPIVVTKAQPKGRPPERGAGPPMSPGGPRGEERVAPRPRRDEPPAGGFGGDSYPPPPPVLEEDVRRAGAKDRRGAGAKKSATPERRGAERGGGRPAKSPRGGAGNWHRWEEDD